ncbi:helicase [Pseudomonas koreensis]|nr:helicase [Pseudomonas koreensis]
MHTSTEKKFLEKFQNLREIPDKRSDAESQKLIEAELNDSPVLIKFWPKTNPDAQRTLHEIWLYEVRQLQRLRGCPGVGDFIAPIMSSSQDDQGFYLVLGAGERKPLQVYFPEKLEGTLTIRHWINNLKNKKNRSRFWRNVIRISQALQLLHSQGILHRNLDLNSILTNAESDEDDFQLTGFEWSIRVNRIKSNLEFSTNVRFEPACFSFLSDWQDLGVLIAKILRLDIESVFDLNHPIKELVEKTELTLDEINIIRGLAGRIRLDTNISNEGINHDIIEPKIQSIIKKLDEINASQEEALGIAFRLTPPNSPPAASAVRMSVFSAVQMAFYGIHGIPISDQNIAEFLQFIQDDLQESPILCIFKNDRGQEEIVLMGSSLTYILAKNKKDRTDTEGTWECAYCTHAYITPPRKIDGSVPSKKIDSSISCFTHNDRSKLSKVYDSWADTILELRNTLKTTQDSRTLLLGFSAYHLAEIAYAKSQIYPVEILSYNPDREDPSQNIIRLKSRSDSSIDDIAQGLGIESPAKRLKKILFDSQSIEPNWFLVSNINFNEEEQEVLLIFQQHQELSGEDIFEFQAMTPDPEYQNYYLIPGSAQGTTKQLSRRAGSIDALSEHSELIAMLENPHLSSMDSHDENIIDAAYQDLDSSKQEALKRIRSTIPLHLVQGPPGVGKTHLVTTLVRQTFDAEPDTRILLTAQSHSTVQHLYQEVKGALEDQHSKPLIVSCIKEGSGDEERDATTQLDDISRQNLENLVKSEAFDKAPAESTKDRILELAKPSNRAMRFSLMSQILKAANLVFTTTNSRQVEDLIKSRAQFDWTVMEETGKATGIELLSPLLLSYRRLMIGDHKQLPPYASSEMRKTLSNLSKLRGAIETSTEVNNSLIKGEFIKETFTPNFIKNLDDQQLQKISHEALRLHLLFETLINEEESVKQKSLQRYGTELWHRPIASPLLLQHRMHPDIADLISHAFYDDKLKTFPAKIDYYKKTPKPFFFEGSCKIAKKLNRAAITWIEIPDAQANLRSHGHEERPTWNNSLERKCVLKLLKKLRTNDTEKAPKLAILSPYSQQVRLLERDIANNSDQLPNISAFSRPDDASSFCKTVDSFQGAEADVVIVSLVRNNGESYASGALGFLLDSRRMNVLLSRAKFQLVIVGSYEFLKIWEQKIRKERIYHGNEDFQFLLKMMQKLNLFSAQSKFVTVKHTQLLSAQ